MHIFEALFIVTVPDQSKRSAIVQPLQLFQHSPLSIFRVPFLAASVTDRVPE
jgi:hypothetical protein